MVVESRKRWLAAVYERAASPLPERATTQSVNGHSTTPSLNGRSTPGGSRDIGDPRLQAREGRSVQVNTLSLVGGRSTLTWPEVNQILILETTLETRPSTSFGASSSDAEKPDAEADDEVKAIAGQARVIQLLDTAPPRLRTRHRSWKRREAPTKLEEEQPRACAPAAIADTAARTVVTCAAREEPGEENESGDEDGAVADMLDDSPAKMAIEMNTRM
ncbi:hypothetical protein FIBSPDRAFT_953732 [Athelia psychrophila]|uniref:Uncharacterized protein n=1 Tax=Athelia psychrophila TaxID=1759441 RepID=A0A166K308_9AGAM|nr:hypothetical protein FIBSPDRAFT_953732 [Fibularhizoctonia sp. CBS 109695]